MESMSIHRCYFLDGNALLNLNCGFPTPVSSGLRARYFGESCNLDAIREI